MKKIAFLGLGAMGHFMALNLVKAGFDVTVWNRTAKACDELVTAGASAAAMPADAAKDADVVISMVRDDVASRQVWLDEKCGAVLTISADAIAIESSTLTPDWVRTLGAELKKRDVVLLEAPVSGSRPQAEQAQLIYLVGGEQTAFERVRPILNRMGSTADQVIGGLGAAALTKLCTNTLMGVQVAVAGELIAMLERNGANVEQTLQALATTPAWSVILQRTSESIVNRRFAPLFPIELLEKDLGYTMQSVGEPASAPVVNTARQAYRAAIAEGLGGEQMTAIYKRYAE
ncbi:NAD(P)-dependent oxidoreductase [Pasteurellaceae bacterium LIM206]|nr:NAD(P)-dependent oxidoreductase [Pasteurellaceae bacterium LIM206]